ncbi:DUF1980 domain-containing protein [Halorientalis marina]|uniref:DUF1980 domain-containing protein n=1 Tax=Halorientalis marina TaxID=2931976 RepID=UPI001FF43B3A|nr:DUF1980 domain-containing protein [Halorientalis marina]
MTDADEMRLDEFRDRAKTGSRIDQAAENMESDSGSPSETNAGDEQSSEETPPSTSNDRNSDEATELMDALDARLEDLEGNDKVISVWDEQFAAVLDTLEEHPDIVGSTSNDLQEALSVQPEESNSQSEIVRIILYAGLNEVAPDVTSALEEVIKRRAVSDL